MITPVHVGLDREDVLRVPPMVSYAGNDGVGLVHGGEQVGKSVLISLYYRVVRILDKKPDPAVVRVDDRLYGVADVVERLVQEPAVLCYPGDVSLLGCGEIVGGRVGVDHPIDTAVEGDRVGVAVVQRNGATRRRCTTFRKYRILACGVTCPEIRML